MGKIKVEYDDQADDVINKINELLKEYHLEVVWEGCRYDTSSIEIEINTI